MGRVQDKVALVTGGASGVGLETVKLLLQEGAFVGISDINAEAGQAFADACGERALFVRHDVASEADWSAAIAAVQARFGPLDILINNAGILIAGSIATATLAQFRQLRQVNADSCFIGCQQGIEAMKERGGSIVNMASVSSWLPIEGYAGYSATKAAVASLGESLATELARTDIVVTTLLPGFIATDMSAGAGDSAALTATLDEGVTAMVRAIESETRRAALPGLKWRGIDAALRFLPNVLTDRMV